MKDIKLIVMDVDGTLTDGRIVLGENHELKFFDARDGMGIMLARRSGIKIGFITGRSSAAVERRARELQVDYLMQDVSDKVMAMDEILEKEKLEYRNVCFIGDDVNDIALMRKAGFSATVADAPDYIKKEASFVSSRPGGRGAVREIIEHILKETGNLESTIDNAVKG